MDNFIQFLGHLLTKVGNFMSKCMFVSFILCATDLLLWWLNAALCEVKVKLRVNIAALTSLFKTFVYISFSLATKIF